MAARTEAAWWDIPTGDGSEVRGKVWVKRLSADVRRVYADLGDGSFEVSRVYREGSGWYYYGQHFRSITQAVLDEALRCMHAQIDVIRADGHRGRIVGTLVQAATPFSCGHTSREVIVAPESTWPAV